MIATPKQSSRFEGLSILDVGCGGGLLCEPLCRLGADITGIDASETNIGIASTHAHENDLAINYQATTAEELADKGETFDVVLTMEVVEHVSDVDLFISECARMVKPGGLMVIATLNRTLKSHALAIIGAEYILRWLPVGTHTWDKFVKPEELERALSPTGLDIIEKRGVTYNPLFDKWSLSKDLDVNYMILCSRAPR